MFHKYNSIENSYNKKILEKFYNNGFHNEEWLAMEKVHGANFSVIVSDCGISYCRRTDILKDGESFFNYQYAVKKDEKTFVEIYNYLKNKYNNITQIQIYGEIFGGNYPHPEIEKNTKVSQVQKEIAYHPDVKFIVFDISYNYDGRKFDYVSHDEVISISEQYNLLYSPILHRGPLDELLKLNPVFETTIPSLFNLPKIENNIAEGYVLKPNKNLFCGESRVIFKHKNEIFKEKNIDNKTTDRVSTNKDSFGESKKIMFSYLNENRKILLLIKFLMMPLKIWKRKRNKMRNLIMLN
jgi:Rnl2 family RNA ligase